MDDDGAKTMGPVQELVPNPEQILFALAIQRNARVDAGMNEEIVARTVTKLERPVKFKMIVRQQRPENCRSFGQSGPRSI